MPICFFDIRWTIYFFLQPSIVLPSFGMLRQRIKRKWPNISSYWWICIITSSLSTHLSQLRYLSPRYKHHSWNIHRSHVICCCATLWFTLKLKLLWYDIVFNNLKILRVMWWYYWKDFWEIVSIDISRHNRHECQKGQTKSKDKVNDMLCKLTHWLRLLNFHVWHLHVFPTVISPHLPAVSLISNPKPMLFNEFDKFRLISPTQICNDLQKVT